MEHARPPTELTLQGGPASRADAWRRWLKQFQVFLKASGVYKEPKELQASLLINLIGSDGYDVYTTFKFDAEEDRDDITKLIEKFNSYFGTKTNTTMVPHEIPGLPWAKLGSDIFEYKSKYYLILVDYFSNFVEVCPLRSITSSSVILAMKDQFARHGIPQDLVTDNGPAYSSREFKKFTESWGITHTTSSPNYPQSNGRSERTVRTIKMILKKSFDSGTDFYIGLLNYRATPRDGIASPAQLLMGRRLNTRLPTHVDNLIPERNNAKDYSNILRNQIRSKAWQDERARALPALREGDDVVALHAGGRRDTARVVGRADQPRSYFITDAMGKLYRRNRRHLIKLELQASSSSTPDRTKVDDEDAQCFSDNSVYDDVDESPDSQSHVTAPALVDLSPPTDQSVVPRPPSPLSKQRHVRAAAIKAKQNLRQ